MAVRRIQAAILANMATSCVARDNPWDGNLKQRISVADWLGCIHGSAFWRPHLSPVAGLFALGSRGRG